MSVTLKDGSQIPDFIYLPIESNLEKLNEQSPQVFNDFVKKCKNLELPLSSASIADLEDRTLLECGEVHEDIQKVVLNSITPLKDGSVVLDVIMIKVIEKLENATKECALALFDLTKKCRDPNHKFVLSPLGDVRAVLKSHGLINADETVPEHVKMIVLNCVEGTGLSMKFVNPLKSKQIAQIG